MDLGSGDTGVRRIDKASEFIAFTFFEGDKNKNTISSNVVLYEEKILKAIKKNKDIDKVVVEYNSAILVESLGEVSDTMLFELNEVNEPCKDLRGKH